jgi:hypothetical protein
MNKMLRASLLSIAALLLSSQAEAQLLCTLGPATPYDPMADMPPSAGAKADFTKVTALLCPKGCGKVVVVLERDDAEHRDRDRWRGVSKMAYSPSFANSIRSNFGPIATFGIFAHGLGHHLDATGTKAAWMKDSWDAELRADAWAGCGMAKANLSPSRLQAVLLALSTYPSPHHPSWEVRRAVITEGFKSCGGRVLPSLAKDEPAPPIRTAVHKEDVVSEAAPGGCTSDKDCRNGRACLNSHCAAAPERRRCGKDTTVPTRRSATRPIPAPARRVRRGRRPRRKDRSKRSRRPRSRRRCWRRYRRPARHPRRRARTRRRASNRATTSGTSASRRQPPRRNAVSPRCSPNPTTRPVSCPNYQAGNVGCYHFCAGAYQRSNACSAAALVKDCRTDGDRCRVQCQP